MPAVSGKRGNIQVAAGAVVHLTKWDFTPSCNIPKFASNTTQGFKEGVEGVFDGEGTMEGAFDPINPIFAQLREGILTDANLILTDNTLAPPFLANPLPLPVRQYTVPIWIKDMQWEVDLDEGTVIKWKASFTTHGFFQQPS